MKEKQCFKVSPTKQKDLISFWLGKVITFPIFRRIDCINSSIYLKVNKRAKNNYTVAIFFSKVKLKGK